MRFKDPIFLILIPLFAFVIFRKKNKGFINYSLVSFILKNFKENIVYRYIFDFLKFIGISLLIIALARPQKVFVKSFNVKNAIDIMLVMDVSKSMNAIDFKPETRIDAMKKASKEFVSKNQNNRIGIVLFSGVPILQCPITSDIKSVLKLIERVRVGMIKIDGTAIGSAIMYGLKFLKKTESPSKVMILLTDGANNMGEITPLEAALFAKSFGVKIYTIGCGKRGPAYLPVEDPIFGKRIIQIPDELDEDTLKKIASITGGKYFRATSLKEFKTIYDEINRMEKRKVKFEYNYEFEERFIPFLISGVIIFFLSFLLKLIFGAYP